MVEVRLQIEDTIVNTFGYSEVENYLKDSLNKLHIKSAAKEILEELKDIDVVNDEQWQLSRQLAWEQERQKYTEI